MSRLQASFSASFVLLALLISPALVSAQPTLQVTPRTYRISQPSLSPVEIPAVETLSDAATFYDFRSASSHTGFEAVGRSLLFLHRDIRLGQDNVSMIVTHGIDRDSSGLSQPTAQVDMTIDGVPSTTTVQVADDNSGEFSLTGSVATGDWSFANNTDGGVLGLLPNDSDWTMTIDIDLIQGISEWQYYYAGGSNIVLDATEPLTIEYNSPQPNTTWETRTISGTTLTLCAGIDSVSGGTSTYTFTWNDTIPNVDSGTTASDSEVVCSQNTFASSGLYTLDIIADDGTGTATATVTIYVEDPTPIPISITTPVDGSTLTTDTTAVVVNTNPLTNIDLYVDGVFAASGVSDTNGLVTFSTADVGQLFDGDHAVELIATDTLGNGGLARADFTVDTVAALTLTSPSVTPSETSDATPEFTGTTEAGADIEVEITDSQGNVVETLTVNAVAAPGDWTVDASTLADGTYNYTVTATDPAGNSSTINGIITVDTISTVAITTPAVDPVFTNDDTPTVSGTSEPGSTVDVSFEDSQGNAVTVSATVDGQGDWTATAPQLTEDTYVVTASVVDALGNPPAVDTLDLTVDLGTTLVVTAPTDGQSDDDSTVLFTGTAEENSTVTVTIRDATNQIVDTFSTTTGNGTSWSEDSSSLADGTYTATVEATDQAGNTDTVLVSFTVDTTAPQLVIAAPADNSNVTNDFAVAGQTEANEDVVVTVDGPNGTFTTTATADSNGDWQADFTAVPAGSYSITASVTDPAGNNAQDTISVTVFDVELTIEQPIDGQVLNDPLPALSGTAAAGATVTFTLNPGPNEVTFTTTTDANGNWYRFPPASLADGAYVLVASVDDGQGGTREETVGFTVDTAAPMVSISNPADGTQLTDNNPVIEGVSDPGSTVTVTVDPGTPGEQIIVTTADMNGDWTAALNTPLTDGPHAVTASSTDDAGNTGSDSVTFEVDATAPALTIQTPADGETTGDTTPLVSGQTEPGVMVEISIDGVVVDTVTADSTGRYSFQTVTPLTDGAHTASATATDDAGNQSSETSSFTVDSSSSFVSIVSPTAGSTVATATPDITGESTPNESIEIFVDGVSVGTTTADANGLWGFTIPQSAALTEGPNTISAEIDNGAGGVFTSSVDIVVDTTPPMVSIVTPVANGLVNTPNPAITGTAEPGSLIEVEIDGVVYQTVTDSSGDWSLVVGNDLLDGTYTANVTATDAAGNTGMTDVNFDVDTVAPSVRITFPDNDTTINNTDPDVRGITEPNATVTVVIDEGTASEETLTATADANGIYSVTPATLSNGVHTARASVTDSAGNTGTANIEFIVDSRAPDIAITSPDEGETFDKGPIEVTGTATPGVEVTIFLDGTEVIQVTADANGDWSASVPAMPGRRVVRATATDPATDLSADDQVAIDIIPPAPLLTVDSPAEGAITSSTTPVISGTANPDEVVEVFVDGTSIGTATADQNGDWTIPVPNSLTDGDHTVEANGEFGGMAGPITFSVDTMAPDVSIDTPTNNTTVGGGVLVIEGSGEPGSTVQVFVDGVEVGEATVDANGDWSFEIDELPDGDHEIEGRTTDEAGNEGSTGVILITVDTTAPELTIDTPSEGEVSEQTPEISGTGEPGATVTIVIDGGEPEEVTVGDDGSWAFQPDSLNPGEHTVEVTSTDASGNTSEPIERTFVIDAGEVEPEPTDPDLFVEGGGCSTGGSDGGLPVSLLILLGVLMLGFFRRRERLAAFAVVLLAVIPAAEAQLETDVNAENFEPLPTQSTNTLNVARSQVLGHLEPSFGLLVHLSDDPLQLGDGEDGVQFRLIDTSLKTEISAAIGLFDYVDIGVIMPLAVFQEGDAAPAVGIDNELDSFALSDLRVVPKFRFLNPEWTGGFGAAVLVPVSLPTGDDVFNSDGTVVVEPRLAVDFVMSGFKLAANVGYEIQDESTALNYVAGDSIKWGAAAEVPLAIEELLLQASIVGAAPLEDGVDIGNGNVSNDRANPIEALGGLKWFAGNGLLAQVGGGAGLTDGVGAPDFRVFAGIEWAGIEKDADGDGILDSEDQCPEVPEDKDGYEDSDGCPDLDNDDDGILDESDGCPNIAEDADGFEDEDGCEDPDNDQDGVLDVDDECPDTAGPAENNGCPWGDKDKDGLMDNEDQCPDEPEDKDGFQDEDGCPDLDNDGDRIADAIDKCPLEPEVINGVDDTDGCPDKGESKVKVTEKKIEILEKVFFDTNKASIKQQSFNILNQVASVLKLYPQIKKIRVEGHTDSRGSSKYNLKLSKERAKAVLDYLVERGVSADRLESEGFGEDQPIADNDTSSGRDQNRRVEFTIMESEKIIEKKVIEDPEITDAPE